jgi:hypothetical protein
MVRHPVAQVRVHLFPGHQALGAEGQLPLWAGEAKEGRACWNPVAAALTSPLHQRKASWRNEADTIVCDTNPPLMTQQYTIAPPEAVDWNCT